MAHFYILQRAQKGIQKMWQRTRHITACYKVNLFKLCKEDESFPFRDL